MSLRGLDQSRREGPCPQSKENICPQPKENPCLRLKKSPCPCLEKVLHPNRREDLVHVGDLGPSRGQIPDPGEDRGPGPGED